MIEAHRKETIVRQRYAAGAVAPQSKLCCHVDYDGQYLKIIPEEVIERDYGCGDPSRYLREGETVLDLGSGTGKVCFIAAQIVGPKGEVVVGGLLNARKVAETMSKKITTMNHGRGFTANLTTAILVVLASLFGLPVSTTHVSVGSLFGIGLTNGKANVRTMSAIVFLWLITLPCAAIIGGTIYWIATSLNS